MQLANYLFFTTSCEAALAFYTHCGLGKVTDVKRYDVAAPAAAMRGKIMHARFEGPGVLFYASDNLDAEPMRGSAHFLTMNDRQQTDRLFGRLAAGGGVGVRLRPAVTDHVPVHDPQHITRQADDALDKGLF